MSQPIIPKVELENLIMAIGKQQDHLAVIQVVEHCVDKLHQLRTIAGKAREAAIARLLHLFMDMPEVQVLAYAVFLNIPADYLHAVIAARGGVDASHISDCRAVIGIDDDHALILMGRKFEMAYNLREDANGCGEWSDFTGTVNRTNFTCGHFLRMRNMADASVLLGQIDILRFFEMLVELEVPVLEAHAHIHFLGLTIQDSDLHKFTRWGEPPIRLVCGMGANFSSPVMASVPNTGSCIGWVSQGGRVRRSTYSGAFNRDVATNYGLDIGIDVTQTMWLHQLRELIKLAKGNAP